MAASENRKAVLELFVRGAKEAKKDIEDVRKAVEDLKKSTGGTSTSVKSSMGAAAGAASTLGAAFKALGVIVSPVIGLLNLLVSSLFSVAQMILNTLLAALHALISVLGNALVQAFGAAGKATVAIIQQFTDFGAKVIKMTSDFEQLRISLRVLYHDAKEGDKVFNFVKRIALEAPFTAKQIAEIAARMKAVGIDPRLERQGIPVLTSISDLAAGMGRNIYDAFFAFKEAAAEGNFISLMRRFSITKANIESTLSAIGEGVDFSTVQGTIDTLTKFIKVNMGGASAELNKSFQGILNRFTDYWEQFLAMIGESGFGDAIKGQAEAVLGVVEGLFSSGDIGVIAGRFSDFFKDVYTGLKTIGEAILGVADWGGAFDTLLDKMTAIGKFFSSGAFEKGVNKAFNWIRQQVADLTKGMSSENSFGANLQQGFENAWKKIEPTVKELGDWASTKIKELGEVLKNVFSDSLEWVKRKFPFITAFAAGTAGAAGWVGGKVGQGFDFYNKNVQAAATSYVQFAHDTMQGGQGTALEKERAYAADVKSARKILEALGILAGVKIGGAAAPSDGLPSAEDLMTREAAWAKDIDKQNREHAKEELNKIDAQRREDTKNLWKEAGEKLTEIVVSLQQKFEQIKNVFTKLAEATEKVVSKFEQLRDARYALGDTIQSVKDKFALLTGASEADVRSSNISRWLAEARDTKAPITRRVQVAQRAFEAGAGAVGSIDAELQGLYKTAGRFGGDQKDWAERSKARTQINELEKQRAEEMKRVEEAQKEYLALLDKQHAETMQKEEASFNELKKHTDLLNVAATALSGSPAFLEKEAVNRDLTNFRGVLATGDFTKVSKEQAEQGVAKSEAKLAELNTVLKDQVFPDIAKSIADAMSKNAAMEKIASMAESIGKAMDITGAPFGEGMQKAMAQALSNAFAGGMGNIGVKFPDRVTIHVDASNFTFEGTGSAEADSGIPQGATP